MDATRRKYGTSGLRKAYRENLEIVLRYVAVLCYELSGTIVITSDHGELLGENGKYGHKCGSKDPLLLEVPWFRVTGVKSIHFTKARLRRRIRKLKRTFNLYV